MGVPPFNSMVQKPRKPSKAKGSQFTPPASRTFKQFPTWHRTRFGSRSKAASGAKGEIASRVRSFMKRTLSFFTQILEAFGIQRSFTPRKKPFRGWWCLLFLCLLKIFMIRKSNPKGKHLEVSPPISRTPLRLIIKKVQLFQSRWHWHPKMSFR